MKNFLQKSKYAFAVFMMSALSCPAMLADDAAKNASSVTLDYQNGADKSKYADMIMNSIYVTKSADSTYFGILDWNCYELNGAGEAIDHVRGGYCGFQQGKGYITRSATATFWDNELPYTFEEACDSFRYSFSPSGDMKGLSISYHCDYAERYWYTIVSRVWSEDGNTKFGFWYLDHTNEFWLHAVNYVYPSKTLVFENNVNSFVDDFAKVNVPSKSSAVTYGPAVTRSLDGVWNSKKSANAYGTYGNDNFTAIAIDGGFDLTLGGKTTTADTANLDASSESLFDAYKMKTYLFEPLTISKAGYANDMISWEILINRLPQFAWEYSVKDLSSDEVILTASSVSADAREAEVLFTKNGTYEITLTLTDIFDNKIDTTFIQKITDKEKSDKEKESVAQETSCFEMLKNVRCVRNKLMGNVPEVFIDVPVTKDSSIVELKIVDKDGNLVLHLNRDYHSSFGPQQMYGPHNYSLSLDLPWYSDECYLKASIDDKKCVSKLSVPVGIYDEPIANNVEGIKYVYSTQYSTVVGFESNVDAKAEISLISMHGWTVKKETISLKKGLNAYVVNGLLFNEVCTVVVNVNGKNYTEKFIVK